VSFSLSLHDALPILLPTYYRGCWHVVSRSLFFRYRHSSSLIKDLYNPKAFFNHAALLRQGCPHCNIFPTAASRRSLGRVSVPMRSEEHTSELQSRFD